MVYWITRSLGIKAVNEELKENEYGAVIVDVRDIKDGVNAPEKLSEVLQRVASTASNPRIRTVIQCQAGISRSPILAAALLSLTIKMSWEDAKWFVKHKCKRMQVNQDLHDQLKLFIEPPEIAYQEMSIVPSTTGTEST